jgi:hypothetical protein
LIKYNFKKRKKYKIFSFLLEDVLSVKKIDGGKKNFKDVIFFFNNLEFLTNYKLARGVYFYRVQKTLFLKLKNLIISKVYTINLFDFFLNSIKIRRFIVV